MSLWSLLFGNTTSGILDSLGNCVDKVYTTDKERLDARNVLEKLKQEAALSQVELNKIESSNSSLFVSGWRAAIGWILAIALGCFVIPYYGIASIIWIRLCLINNTIVTYPISPTPLIDLTCAILGIYGTHVMIEKISKKGK